MMVGWFREREQNIDKKKKIFCIMLAGDKCLKKESSEEN